MEWWSKAPMANIGIPMGEKSGLVALDVDTRHDGDKSLTDMIEEFGELSETITATTGSGGKHYVFKYTEELCLKNVVGFRDGLDIRTQGGLIVAAPSMHQSGNRYAWDAGKSPYEMEAAEMPGWLVDEIRKVGTQLTEKKKPADKAPLKKIVEGGRNNHLRGNLHRAGTRQEFPGPHHGNRAARHPRVGRSGLPHVAARRTYYAGLCQRGDPSIQGRNGFVYDLLYRVLRGKGKRKDIEQAAPRQV